jgi:hypothetical protein
MLLCLLFVQTASADEAGVSFWLPGQYGSYSAVPSDPGWSFESTFYHATAAADASTSFARGGGIRAGMSSPSDLLMLTQTYTFATPVLAGQAAIGMTSIFGRNATSVTATLTGPGGRSLSGSAFDEVIGFGDLYPTATLKWNRDVHNVMVYATTGIPVGFYSAERLAALGLGHWAVDSGAGYTYLNEQAKFEWTVVAGLTYNFINPATQYQSGVDAHIDWAILPYASDKWQIGAVGYFYRQLTADSGAGATLGEFKSRVAGIGPQIGFAIPVGGQEAYLNIRSYYEFDARNRLAGWTAYVTLSMDAPDVRAARTARKP